MGVQQCADFQQTQMKPLVEDHSLSTIQPPSHSQTTLNIPLMSKKPNPMERYINSYKKKQQNSIDCADEAHKERINSTFTSNAERMVFGSRFEPEPQMPLLDDNRCYVKYSPLREHRTEDRLELLHKIENQYQHLKSNMSGSKEPFTSKYTLPLHRRRRQRDCSSELSRERSHQEIRRQLKKEVVVKDGQKYFLDLYLMSKDRSEIKDEIQKNRKLVKEEEIEDKYREHEKYFLDKKEKQAEQKKNKMLKNKGLHWNVYYEMLALSSTEKKRLKGANSSFVETYGTN